MQEGKRVESILASIFRPLSISQGRHVGATVSCFQTRHRKSTFGAEETTSAERRKRPLSFLRRRGKYVVASTLMLHQALAAAIASISISHSGLTRTLTMIVAEPGSASPKCFARDAPAAPTSFGRI